jgi:hypothetical protein
VIFWKRLLVFKFIVNDISCLLRRFPQEVLFQDGSGELEETNKELQGEGYRPLTEFCDGIVCVW